MTTRVLFLAFGYSIHARRRIQLFINDPSFEVAVVSPHDYAFSGAKNYLLRSNVFWRLVGAAREKFADTLPLELLHHLSRAGRDLITLRHAVAEFRPHLVFMQTLVYPSYLGYALPHALPFIITFWNGDVTWWAKYDGIEKVLKKQIVTYGARRAAAVTVNSQAALQACLDYGCDRSRVHLIRYPGVDLERFFPASQTEARRQLGIPAGKVVLCPRGLGTYLNSEVIVAAIPEVARNHPDVLFVFASGAGAESLPAHQQLARRLGVEKHCRWEGQVAWEKMPLYYNASDAMVSMSSNDSLPNCMMEAMACGVPVVMGDIPPIREWITHEENGFLVNCHDHRELALQLQRCFDDQETTREFTLKNRAAVEQKADGKRNNQRLKQLVHQIAQPGAPC